MDRLVDPIGSAAARHHDGMEINVQPMYFVDIMGDAVGQHTMGREKRMQFGGYHITATGPTTPLGQLNLCYGDGLEENDGHYRCLGMESIYDGDDRPQRTPSGIIEPH